MESGVLGNKYSSLSKLYSAITNKVNQDFKKVVPTSNVQYILKNGFCSLIWLGIPRFGSPAKYGEWVTVCTVPAPQHDSIYASNIQGIDNVEYRVTNTGVFQYKAKSGQSNYLGFGALFYPTDDTG